MSVAERLRQARRNAGYDSAAAASRALKISKATYAQHENGIRGVPRDAAVRYAREYGVSVEWLLTGRGGMGSNPGVPVVGYVGAGAELHAVDDYPVGHGLEQVDPPPGESDCVAVRIRGDSMHPFQEGWLVFYRREAEGVPEDCIGKLCVVKIEEGPTLVKMLRRGSRKGRWTLESWNAPPREDAVLAWAS